MNIFPRVLIFNPFRLCANLYPYSYNDLLHVTIFHKDWKLFEWMPLIDWLIANDSFLIALFWCEHKERREALTWRDSWKRGWRKLDSRKMKSTQKLDAKTEKKTEYGFNNGAYITKNLWLNCGTEANLRSFLIKFTQTREDTKKESEMGKWSFEQFFLRFLERRKEREKKRGFDLRILIHGMGK